ncbi:ABC transporter ATP-binding protein [Pseudomonas knackmussii]|uniref:ABC transporter ATP-binding protein n=1 Tax=Pseudomonas knackmussii TaxID=65741 RepID=UPI0013627CC8|nr:ABC transporter ATP-binding protein [Pseudomonas knackmussii]
MNVLSVKNTGKSYRNYRSEWQRFAGWFGMNNAPRDEHWVIRNISFEVRSGESIGILGKNGAGKSTLLKIVTGTLQPSEGSVISTGRISAILELGMGFNPELTGRQNALHSAGLMGFSKEETLQALPNIEAFADIGEYFDNPVRTYSSGMQARVAFAVATAFRPDILIVDEALSVGDAYFQAKCYKRIDAFKKQGTSLILVTHSTADVVKHCDRALFISEGHLVKDGAPAEVTNLYLDELFGKRKSKSPAAEKDQSLTFTASTDDLFNTRPGYRKDEHRWGQGGAIILDYRISTAEEAFPAQIECGERVEISFKVQFTENHENVVPGLLIRTLEGLYLYGTNSFISSRGVSNISAQAGQIRIFRFTLPLNLNEGDYMISFGVSAGTPPGELIPLERRYDSVIVKVYRTQAIWGVIDLNAEFESSELTI